MKALFTLLLLVNSMAYGSSPIESHYKKLTEKRGDMVKVWDQHIKAAKNGDKKAMESIFHVSTAHFSGYYLATYKFDLHEIFKSSPKFFISEGKKYFKDSGMCNMYWLLPRTGEIEAERVFSVFKKNPELRKDYKLAKKFNSFSEKERNENTRNCYKVNE